MSIDSFFGLNGVPNPRSGNGRSLSCARAWFHKASSTRSGCVLGDTAREAKSLVESMTDANRRSAIPESRLILKFLWSHDTHFGFVGDHGVIFEKLTLEPRDQSL
jgi:hypothetical protein